jgi:hypothetical protein
MSSAWFVCSEREKRAYKNFIFHFGANTGTAISEDACPANNWDRETCPVKWSCRREFASKRPAASLIVERTLNLPGHPKRRRNTIAGTLGRQTSTFQGWVMFCRPMLMWFCVAAIVISNEVSGRGLGSLNAGDVCEWRSKG